MSDHSHVHIVGPATYLKNLVFLMVMMFLTVAAATVHFGSAGSQALNLTVALVIAFSKMTAIMLFFMHVKYSSGLVRLFALIAFAFMAIFYALTFGDYISRNNNYYSNFVPNPYGETPAAVSDSSHH